MNMTALEYVITALGHYHTLEKTPENERALECLRLAIEQLHCGGAGVYKIATKQIKVEIFTGKQTVQQINDWLSKNPVRVINIETVSETSGGYINDVKLSKAGTKVWYEELTR